MERYMYGMRLRGAQPKDGFVRREDATPKSRYHDIIIYNRELTEKELRDYELDFLGEYDFRIHNAICGFRNEILVPDSFPDWSEYQETNGIAEWGIAVLEMGWVDIELNIGADCKDDGSGYVNKPYTSYFMCIKGNPTPGATDWRDFGYLDDIGYDVNINWKSNDWIEQLEKDMYQTLIKVIERYDLKTDKSNWTGNAWLRIDERLSCSII